MEKNKISLTLCKWILFLLAFLLLFFGINEEFFYIRVLSVNESSSTINLKSFADVYRSMLLQIHWLQWIMNPNAQVQHNEESQAEETQDIHCVLLFIVTSLSKCTAKKEKNNFIPISFWPPNYNNVNNISTTTSYHFPLAYCVSLTCGTVTTHKTSQPHASSLLINFLYVHFQLQLT